MVSPFAVTLNLSFLFLTQCLSFTLSPYTRIAAELRLGELPKLYYRMLVSLPV